MAKVVTAEALKDWNELARYAKRAWDRVASASREFQAKQIDADEWSRRIEEHREAAKALDLWRRRHIQRP